MDQLEALAGARLELSSFEALHESECVAIPRRLSAIVSDVERQKVREKELQTLFSSLRASLYESSSASNTGSNRDQ